MIIITHIEIDLRVSCWDEVEVDLTVITLTVFILLEST
ncbi:unnamed protein product [Schistosoma curassoni]|uniref:Uncharacterized protein n=1 Tax=Schistosoma curassoni TaxID=6186 RepID=A0A183KIT0_9TREM|nr:unnamed protein product [Schistosoma curassoni]